MKRLIYLLLAMPLFFTSCSKDEEMVSEESVQVSFSTELPKRIGTRASTTDLNVNKVVCAVFEDGEEIGTLREVITIQEGEDIVFAPRLINRFCSADTKLIFNILVPTKANRRAIMRVRHEHCISSTTLGCSVLSCLNNLYTPMRVLCLPRMSAPTKVTRGNLSNNGCKKSRLSTINSC